MNTTILLRPAARGGKYLGPDASNENHKSAVIALMDVNTQRWVAAGLVDASNPLSAGPPDLMEPVSRAAPFDTDSNTVQIQFNVDIETPTTFRALVYGPLSHPDQARITQSDITVLPGVDIGTSLIYPEGLVLEVPGLCISKVQAVYEGATLSCTAMLTMMCGCQIHKYDSSVNWPWPDTDFKVEMVVKLKSGARYFYFLGFDDTLGVASSFTGSWVNQADPNDAVEEVWLYACQPKLGNQGAYRIFPENAPAQVELPSEIMELMKKG